MGWEHALLDSKSCDFFDLEAFDATNKVETKNYDLEYYVSKENLGVEFVEELDGEDSSIQGDDSQVSLPSLGDHPTKDQA